MIKKMLLFLGVSAMLAFPAYSATDEGVGCGVGAIVMDGKSGKNSHIVASIIDQVVGSFQLWGMTSGTLGCDTSKKIQPYGGGSASFIHKNQAQFLADVSRGEGEVLDNFVTLMKVEKQDQQKFKSTLKSNFSNIFNNPVKNSSEVMDSINQVLLTDSELGKYAI